MKNDKYLWPQNRYEVWIDDVGIADLVSVIVPTYNRNDYILETLDSVWRQVYRPIELIIVDDGSTDSTKATVSKWSDHHSSPDFQVHYRFQENSGAPVARNHGTLESKGDYIQYLDSDDLLDAEKIRIQVSSLRKQPDRDLVLANVYAFQEGDDPVRYLDWDPDSMCPSDYFERVISGISFPNFHTMSPLFRRQTLCRFGPWHPELHCLQEVEYSNRLFLGGAKLARTPKAKCFFRHDTSGSRERVGYYGETSPEKKRDYAISLWIRLFEMWRKIPDVYQGDPLFRQTLMRHTIISCILLAGSRVTDRFHESLSHIRHHAKGSGFFLRIMLLSVLTLMMGMRGALFYRVIQLLYSVPLAFVRSIK